MDVHQISFAKITVLRNDLAEIVVDNGVDINVKMVNEIHAVKYLIICTKIEIVQN